MQFLRAYDDTVLAMVAMYFFGARVRLTDMHGIVFHRPSWEWALPVGERDADPFNPGRRFVSVCVTDFRDMDGTVLIQKRAEGIVAMPILKRSFE